MEPFSYIISRFYTRGRIIRRVLMDNASMAVSILTRIIRLGELGQTLVVRLVMRLKYKDGHKRHYATGRTFLRNTS